LGVNLPFLFLEAENGGVDDLVCEFMGWHLVVAFILTRICNGEPKFLWSGVAGTISFDSAVAHLAPSGDNTDSGPSKAQGSSANSWLSRRQPSAKARGFRGLL
jgi:hypothetical protein